MMKRGGLAERILRTAVITAGVVMTFSLFGCGKQNDEQKPEGLVVGQDIKPGDVNDFYYTEENINYDAYYIRYRFYKEDGKPYFFYELRERKDDYGPATEEDVTGKGTFKLSEEEWAAFIDLINGGTVKARSESADSGDSGPWLYLYWTGDEAVYQEYSFSSYKVQKEFVALCESMAK